MNAAWKDVIFSFDAPLVIKFIGFFFVDAERCS